MITPDAHAAAIGVAAWYAYWKLLQEPTWCRAVVAGGLLGLAQLTKLTFIVFYVIWPVCWYFYRFRTLRRANAFERCRESAMIFATITLSIYLINVGYGFSGSLQRLGSYRFQSAMLGTTTARDATGNRFSGTVLEGLPVPLPHWYVQGIDTQRLDFERGMASYLRGAWQSRGWWYYYLYALGVKVPLGTWLLLALAVVMTFVPRRSGDLRDEMVLLLPAVAILVLLSSQSGFSIHSRYALPTLPFCFVWISKVGRLLEERSHSILRATIVAAMVFSVASSLWTFPHSISYFNELVGGPRNGPAHLLGSDVDWGQDLLYLRKHLDEHPDADAWQYAISEPYELECVLGIPFRRRQARDSGLNEMTDGPDPGWHAIDVGNLWGPNGDYSYFRKLKPVTTAGYTIYIYCVSAEEADRARKTANSSARGE